ncbi:hypothetical protein IF1G_06559 [Cordyceps javanica]|uniref:Uncharacterized protein n=1 Tax=Cordyceps javanica TaxID=43265 RepID=A0A545VXH9_9HYPO|nr:hypothetical protein IF1G_06559 [Cordyceps javanica]TQW06422.1 hypothetical protein IF2G_05844 [Cordyceps javanica]
MTSSSPIIIRYTTGVLFGLGWAWLVAMITHCSFQEQVVRRRQLLRQTLRAIQADKRYHY